jgi:hypothetical protein
MTVYSELMRTALEMDDRPPGSIAGMVRDALSSRKSLDQGTGSVARIGDALIYDVTLVRLCERLHIDHDLAGETAGAQARRRAEHVLADRIPLLAAGLAGDR